MLLEITALQVTGAFAGEAPAGTSKFFPGQLHGSGLWDNTNVFSLTASSRNADVQTSRNSS